MYTPAIDQAAKFLKCKPGEVPRRLSELITTFRSLIRAVETGEELESALARAKQFLDTIR